jgi:uncharacterized protein DUF5677
VSPTARADDNPERVPLEVLTDLQAELSIALNSLGDQLSKAITDRYYFNAAGYINSAADGYLILRSAGRADASKLLIRPAIEMMIRIQALRRQPDLFYQIGFTESEDDKKWFRAAAARVGAPYDDKADPPGWGEFETIYKQEFPNTSPKRSILTLACAAQVAGLKDYYDSHYRMYCKYAHAALRATGGYLDDMSDPEDTRTMVTCMFSALDAVVAIGASAPHFKALRARCDDLSMQPRIRLRRVQVE